eukprot:TRINITY_DN14659_c0_g1_i1.p1 TRINITY_DN14659_c0_g1~~TRINITY_DN14659_c0_g1_i1.p1  ORF type:complete len:339 (+),score=97.23 TRINITY_DN14659_c0_g1_i1:101-1117(+)
MVRLQVKKEVAVREQQQIQKKVVEAAQVPDRVFPVSKLQVRAGRKVELFLGDLMRSMFRGITITLNTKTTQYGTEKERRYIPQPCPKIWKKRGGNKTNTAGTAKTHLAVLKETKRGLAINQVNIGILGHLINPTTGERCFYGNYSLVIRLDGNEGFPSYVLPFDLAVVTSHNHGNNTTQLDVARLCGFPSEEEDEEDEDSEHEDNEKEVSQFPVATPCYEIVWPVQPQQQPQPQQLVQLPQYQQYELVEVKSEPAFAMEEYTFYPAGFETYREQRLTQISLESVKTEEDDEETVITTPLIASPVFENEASEPTTTEYTLCWDPTFTEFNTTLYDSCVM